MKLGFFAKFFVNSFMPLILVALDVAGEKAKADLDKKKFDPALKEASKVAVDNSIAEAKKSIGDALGASVTS